MGVDCYAVITKNKKAVVIEVPRDWCSKSEFENDIGEDIEKIQNLVEEFYEEIVPNVEEAKGDEVANVVSLGNFIRIYTMLSELARECGKVLDAGYYWVEVVAERNGATVKYVSEATIEEYLLEKLRSDELEEVIIMANGIEIEHEKVIYF